MAHDRMKERARIQAQLVLALERKPTQSLGKGTRYLHCDSLGHSLMPIGVTSWTVFPSSYLLETRQVGFIHTSARSRSTQVSKLSGFAFHFPSRGGQLFEEAELDVLDSTV